MHRSVRVALLAGTGFCIAILWPSLAYGGLRGRGGSVRYAAAVAAWSADQEEPWNAGFSGAPGSANAPREIATVNQGSGVSPRGVSVATGRISYGAAATEGPAPSSGNPVWDMVAMSNYLAEQQNLTLEMIVTTERASEAGQKVQSTSRQVTYLQRPDKLAVEIATDKAATRIVYDGTGVRVVEATRNLYGSIPIQGNLESVLDRLANDYGMAVPANDLLCKGRYERIREKIKFARDLGRETLDGRSYNHSIFSNDEVDLQTWVESRERPVPRRVVIVYKNLPGRPRCTLDITRVDTAPIPDSIFKADVPAGAQQITIVPR